MRNGRGILQITLVILIACAAKSADNIRPPPGVELPDAGIPHTFPGMPGAIAIECTAIVRGYADYGVSMHANRVDICSVGGDGMLTLTIKGRGSDTIGIYLASYHGAGNYPIGGSSASYVNFGNSTGSQGRSQTTSNCRPAACEVNVTVSSAGAAAGTRHLGFALSCAKVCDSDTHTCTSSGGAPITWSGSADCRVP